MIYHRCLGYEVILRLHGLGKQQGDIISMRPAQRAQLHFAGSERDRVGRLSFPVHGANTNSDTNLQRDIVPAVADMVAERHASPATRLIQPSFFC